MNFVSENKKSGITGTYDVDEVISKQTLQK